MSASFLAPYPFPLSAQPGSSVSSLRDERAGFVLLGNLIRRSILSARMNPDLRDTVDMHYGPVGAEARTVTVLAGSLPNPYPKAQQSGTALSPTRAASAVPPRGADLLQQGLGESPAPARPDGALGRPALSRWRLAGFQAPGV